MRTFVGVTIGGRDRTFSSMISRDDRLDVCNTHPTLNILLSTPETMFEQSIKDATKAKRGLDDVGCEFANW
jgi:hypothetical protein